MTIIFDLFFYFNVNLKDFPEDEREILEEILVYIYQRINTISDEINAEEISQKSGTPVFICVHFFEPPEHFTLLKIKTPPKISISANNYSLKLFNKIESLFNDNDFVILDKRLELIWSRWGNK